MLLMAAVAEELGDLDGVPVGIGPVASAASAAAALAARRPSAVLLLGTCGAYPGGPPIGSVVVAERVGLAFGVAAMGLGYVPRAPAPIACSPDLTSAVQGPRVAVLSCGAVTTDEVLVGRLSDGWQCEHLESFGVALACREAGVPFAAVLGISNLVGPNAHTEWLSHRESAQRAAREAVLPLVQG